MTTGFAACAKNGRKASSHPKRSWKILLPLLLICSLVMSGPLPSRALGNSAEAASAIWAGSGQAANLHAALETRLLLRQQLEEINGYARRIALLKLNAVEAYRRTKALVKSWREDPDRLGGEQLLEIRGIASELSELRASVAALTVEAAEDRRTMRGARLNRKWGEALEAANALLEVQSKLIVQLESALDACSRLEAVGANGRPAP